MKIALLHPAFGVWGGAENVVLWLARELVRRGHVVTVLAGEFSPPARQALLSSGARVELLTFMRGRQWQRLQMGSGGVRLLPASDHVVRLDRRAMQRGAKALARRLHEFDVVNVHNFPATWWVAEAYRAVPSLPPLVWSCNEPPRTLYPDLFEGADFALCCTESPLVSHDRNRVGRSAQSILCISEYVRQRVAAIYGRHDARCLHLGIPLPASTPTLLWHEDAPRLLLVSRLVPAKNVDCALQALEFLPQVRLDLVGDGAERARLQALASDLGVADRVRFLGYVGEVDMPRHYAQADVLLFLPIGEPFGLVLLEAGAAGLPSVASNHGGPSEIVVDRETGCLADPRSPQAVAEAVRAVLPRRREMGAAAARRVRERFTLERYVDDYLAALTDLPVGGKRA